MNYYYILFTNKEIDKKDINVCSVYNDIKLEKICKNNGIDYFNFVTVHKYVTKFFRSEDDRFVFRNKIRRLIKDIPNMEVSHFRVVPRDFPLRGNKDDLLYKRFA